MEPINEEALRKKHQLAVYIGYAMIASLFIYAGVIEYLAATNAPFRGFSPLRADVYDKLRLVLLGVAIFDFAVIPYIRNNALAAGNQLGAVANANPSGLLDRLVTTSVISYALCESIAIYGLVLFLTNGGRQEFYLFLAISLAAYVFYFPRYNRWKDWLRSMQRETLQRPVL